jgi:sigma-B regulation protein RsbU (phosphoserine phosphatase)
MDPVAGQYFTLLYGVLDTRNYELTYVQAGHPGPIHLMGDTSKGSVLQGCGLPIGFQDEVVYSEFKVQLNAGDRLYLYSDGVPEALNADEEQFGEQRLLESIERSNSLELAESLNALKNQLVDWCGESGLRDDVSLLALELEK